MKLYAVHTIESELNKWSNTLRAIPYKIKILITDDNILVFWVLAPPNRPVDPVAVVPNRPVPVCDGVTVPNPVVAVVLAPKRLPPVPKPVLNLKAMRKLNYLSRQAIMLLEQTWII